MGRRTEPIERKRAKARGDGRTPGGREVAIPDAKLPRTVKVPRAPAGLKRRGSLEWHKVWESGSWLSPQQDYHWVEQISRAYDDIDQFRVRVDEDGLVQHGSLGQPVGHPLLAEIRKCEATIRQCLSIIGFSPSDRSRLGLAEVQRQSKLQEMMKAAAK